MARFTLESQVFLENSDISVLTIMRLFAIVEKRVVWKPKLPVLLSIVFYWNVLKMEKVLFYQPEYPQKRIPLLLTRLSLQ